MVVSYIVNFTAKLHNITDVRPWGGDGPNYGCFFEMSCTNCNGVKNKYIMAIPDAQWSNIATAPTGALKCDVCKKEGKVSVDTSISTPLSHESGANNMYTPLLLLKCKGFAPLKCIFSGFWRGDSMTESIFYEDIDLSEGDYEVYNEEGDLQGGIYQPRVIFEVVQDQDSKSKKSKWQGESSAARFKRMFN